LWRQAERVRGTPLAGVGLIIVFWVVLFLFVDFVQGFQGFQNYYSNAYLWLLSGAVFALPAVAGARDVS
jgi:hypothetical protein